MNKEKLTQIVKENPNNIELGKTLRKLYDGIFTVDINGEKKTINMSRDYPNDMSLGEAVRTMILSQ
jgi:hypothetical protein